MKSSLLFKRIIISSLVFVIFFTLLEVLLRLLMSSNTVLNLNIGGFLTYHPTRQTQLKRNYQEGNILINTHGILGPEFDVQKPKQKLRILTIGNSVTFSPPKRNYTLVMQEKLQTFFPNEEIEAVCGAVPGYCSFKALDWYDDFLHQLNADIAIVYLGWNDMGQFNPFGLRYKNEGLVYRERTWIGALMENVYILRIPYFVLGRIESKKNVDFSPLTNEEKAILDSFTPLHYKQNLISLITKLRNQNSTVYLTDLPGLLAFQASEKEMNRMHFPRGLKKKLAIYESIYLKYVVALEEVFEETDTPIIRLTELIKTEKEREIFTDTMHITEEGAVKYGGYLAEYLQPKLSELLDKRNQ